MKRLLLRVFIAASASTTLAHAEGPYVGADVVFGHYGFDVAGVSSDNDTSNNVSGRILAGYNFNHTWAIEGGYAEFGTAKYDFSVNGTHIGEQVSSHSLYVAAKASVPINEVFSLYSKLGVACNHVNHQEQIDSGFHAGATTALSDSNTGLYAGLGAQYKLNDQLAMTLEFEHYGPLDSVGGTTVLVSTGLRYSF